MRSGVISSSAVRAFVDLSLALLATDLACTVRV